MYGSWEMLRDGQMDGRIDGQKKWHIEVGAPPKNEENTWRYHHFTIVFHHDHTYGILFLRYGMWQMKLFFNLGHFLSSYPLNIPKTQD